MTRYSILDLAPVPQGLRPGDALRNSSTSRGMPSGWATRRYWVAEHHNMPGIASAATSVVIGHVAGGTTTHPRRRGRHHAAQPLAAGDRRAVRHAGRAVSRAASTSGSAARRAPTSGPLRALRRDPMAAEQFPAGRAGAAGAARAGRSPARRSAPCPAPARSVPLWILGSSLFGAQLAAMLGPALRVRLAFRARRADAGPGDLPPALPALGAARQAPTPWPASTSSPPRPTPRRGACSRRAQQSFANLHRAARAASCRRRSTTSRPTGRRRRRRRRRACCACSVVGSRETVRAGLERFIAQTGVDEVMVVSAIYDHQARIRSYEILAEIAPSILAAA